MAENDNHLETAPAGDSEDGFHYNVEIISEY